MRQCYDTQSYDAAGRSLVFHHVRTVTPSGGGIQLRQPKAMVGTRRRLFVLDNSLPSNIISRIDPVSGQIDLSWLVDRFSKALSVTASDHLLLTSLNRLQQFDTDGHLLRVVLPTGLENLLREHCRLRMSLLLPDSTYRYRIFQRIHCPIDNKATNTVACVGH